jgi:hypothetical protein
MNIQVDGRDHPIRFGNNLRLRAQWRDARTLETVVTDDGETIVAIATYEMSPDGRSLVVSGAERTVVFERV